MFPVTHELLEILKFKLAFIVGRNRHHWEQLFNLKITMNNIRLSLMPSLLWLTLHFLVLINAIRCFDAALLMFSIAVYNSIPKQLLRSFLFLRWYKRRFAPVYARMTRTGSNFHTDFRLGLLYRSYWRFFGVTYLPTHKPIGRHNNNISLYCRTGLSTKNETLTTVWNSLNLSKG